MSDFETPSRLLVIAKSGRMLAQMAVNASIVPVVIDCFADLDTRQLAVATLKVNSLAWSDIQTSVAKLKSKYALTHLLYGSGFESHIESLTNLQQDWVVLGNSSAVFQRLQDKPDFFRQLDSLGIPYPETVFSPPSKDKDWLRKPYLGQGGEGIGWFDVNTQNYARLPAAETENKHEVVEADHYWQRYVAGQPMSVTFIAAADKMEVLGFNRQWTVEFEGQPFSFGGIASGAELDITHKNRLLAWLQELIKVYGLRGLASLDFIMTEAGLQVLEINPRIPASAQLYGKNILQRHLQACLDLAPDNINTQLEPSGYQILFAAIDVQIPSGISWPEWALDRPDCGANIGKGQPICSIIASGKSPENVAEQLDLRRQFIENILNTGS